MNATRLGGKRRDRKRLLKGWPLCTYEPVKMAQDGFYWQDSTPSPPLLSTEEWPIVFITAVTILCITVLILFLWKALS